MGHWFSERAERKDFEAKERESMKPKHASGPWHIAWDTIYVGPDTHRLPLAKDVRPHNARLIVVAPEMYDLLKVLVNADLNETVTNKIKEVLKRVDGNG